MRLLFWKEDKKHPEFSGKKFTLFKVSWDKKTRAWVKSDLGRHWGLEHPVDGRIIVMKKAPEKYGRVIETPDISISTVLGTPTLGIVDRDEEE